MADFVQMFRNSSDFTINGGSFSNIGRDMNVYNTNPEELQRLVEVITHQLQLYSRRNLPPAIGHTSANALVLNDALGETLTIPWSLVSSYEDLHDTLVKHFKHKLGEKHVVRRDYCIAQEHGGTLVNAETWNEAMDTGEELTMIMLLDRIWLEEASKLCPKCGKTQIGTYENDGWRICRRCNTQFRCAGKSETQNGGLLVKKEDNELQEEAAFRRVQGRFRGPTYAGAFNPRSVALDIRTPEELAAVNEFLLYLGQDVSSTQALRPSATFTTPTGMPLVFDVTKLGNAQCVKGLQSRNHTRYSNAEFGWYVQSPPSDDWSRTTTSAAHDRGINLRRAPPSNTGIVDIWPTYIPTP